jgi:hypothetical protein
VSNSTVAPSGVIRSNTTLKLPLPPLEPVEMSVVVPLERW